MHDALILESVGVWGSCNQLHTGLMIAATNYETTATCSGKHSLRSHCFEVNRFSLKWKFDFETATAGAHAHNTPVDRRSAAPARAAPAALRFAAALRSTPPHADAAAPPTSPPHPPHSLATYAGCFPEKAKLEQLEPPTRFATVPITKRTGAHWLFHSSEHRCGNTSTTVFL